MTYTDNLHLSLPGHADPLDIAPIAANFQTLDAALGPSGGTALQTQLDALSATVDDHTGQLSTLSTRMDAVASGNAVRVVSGSYTGSGSNGSGSGRANSITFSFTPLLVFIRSGSSSDNAMGSLLNPSAFGMSCYSSALLTVTWSGRTVTWYNNSSAQAQMNTSGAAYYYVAIGKA